MKANRYDVLGSRGMVLIGSLAILSLLVVVGIGAGLMLRNDFQVLANLRSGTEAFYFSAAGVEWGKQEIARDANFPPAPANQSKNFASGEFAVSFLSSATVGPLAARVVVRSTGTSRGAQQILQAQLTKSYDLADAALALRGNAAGVNLSAPSLWISGADHDAATAKPIVGAKSRNSVSTAEDSIRDLVLSALGDPPRQDVLDSGPDMAQAATSDYLSADFVAQFANALCSSAHAVVHAIPDTGALVVENQAWGNQETPELHCVEGLAAAGDATTMTGTMTGTGILVVRDADLIVSGNLRWEGLVLVTGSDISLKTTGPGSFDLLGAALVHETGIPPSGRAMLDLDGTTRLLFSRQGLNRALSLIPATLLDSAYGSLPSTIAQDYWRAVTP